LFYDTTNNILKIRNEDNDAFISLFTLDQSNDNIESLTINGAFACEGFTSNGIDDNADATAITIDSSENVLIGTTTANPADNNDASGLQLSSIGSIQASVSNATPSIFNRGNDGAITGFLKAGSSVGSISYSNDTNIAINNANSKGIGIGSTSVFPTDGSTSVSNGGLSLGYANGRWNNLYLSGSVFLGGTGSANQISDYEEGTFTPTFLATSNPTVTYSIQSGHYTKIGRMVHVSVRLATNGVSGGSGTLRIGGLPFSSSSTSNLISVGAVTAHSWTGEHPMKFRIINNGTDIYLYYRSSLTANDLDNNSNVTDLTTSSGGFNITEVTATYFT
jgi:hypothetical protein